jgi:hypothetical protein
MLHFGRRKAIMKLPEHRPLDDLDHDTSSMLRLLDVWHHEMPAPLRRQFRKCLVNMGKLILKVRAAGAHPKRENT